MNNHISDFILFEPGERFDRHEIAAAVGAGPGAASEAVFDALNLVESAAAFFRGMFPIEAPHFVWGELISLPWMCDYVRTGGSTLIEMPIRAEVQRIASALARVAEEDSVLEPWGQVTYYTYEMCESGKTVVQGLAVEAMLAVDGYLRRVQQGQFVEAMPWLNAGYKNIIECTYQAHILVDSSNAKGGLRAPERGNTSGGVEWRRPERERLH